MIENNGSLKKNEGIAVTKALQRPKASKKNLEKNPLFWEIVDLVYDSWPEWQKRVINHI